MNLRSLCVRALLLGTLALSTACSKATADNYAKVEAGMSRAQVHEILGKPGEVNGASIGPLSVSTETWKAGKQVITITFTGDSVGFKSIQNTDDAKP